MESGLLILISLLSVAGGILCLLIGLLLSDHLDQLLLLFTHSDTPSYVKDKEGVASTFNYIKAVGIMFKILGVGFIVLGIVKIGVFIF